MPYDELDPEDLPENEDEYFMRVEQDQGQVGEDEDEDEELDNGEDGTPEQN
jgi:hypothetical protein